MELRVHPKMKWEGYFSWPPSWRGAYGWARSHGTVGSFAGRQAATPPARVETSV
jgi:hypothetical protein